ncbi:hypothetical protein H4K36_00940 [Streptomyces sp. DHE7-1]|nr:hypothetical protein [Streptomyces sp. DHE7-1]
MYAQTAGAIGVLATAFGVLAAIKDKLGLTWPATVLLTAGALIASGYGAWKAKTAAKRLWAHEPKASKAQTAAGTQAVAQAVTLPAGSTLPRSKPPRPTRSSRRRFARPAPSARTK